MTENGGLRALTGCQWSPREGGGPFPFGLAWGEKWESSDTSKRPATANVCTGAVK